MYIYCKIMMSKMLNWVSKIEMINVSISGEKVNAPFWHPQQRKHTRPYWAKWIPSPAGMLIQSFLVPKYAALYICMQKLLSIPMVSTRIHDILNVAWKTWSFQKLKFVWESGDGKGLI